MFGFTHRSNFFQLNSVAFFGTNFIVSGVGFVDLDTFEVFGVNLKVNDIDDRSFGHFGAFDGAG
jgi:hypothetical protein